MQIYVFINWRVKQTVRFLLVCQFLCFRVGLKDVVKNNDIQLSGFNIFEEYCFFYNSEGKLYFFCLMLSKIDYIRYKDEDFFLYCKKVIYYDCDFYRKSDFVVY